MTERRERKEIAKEERIDRERRDEGSGRKK